MRGPHCRKKKVIYYWRLEWWLYRFASRLKNTAKELGFAAFSTPRSDKMLNNVVHHTEVILVRLVWIYLLRVYRYIV